MTLGAYAVITSPLIVIPSEPRDLWRGPQLGSIAYVTMPLVSMSRRWDIWIISSRILHLRFRVTVLSILSSGGGLGPKTRSFPWQRFHYLREIVLLPFFLLAMTWVASTGVSAGSVLVLIPGTSSSQGEQDVCFQSNRAGIHKAGESAG